MKPAPDGRATFREGCDVCEEVGPHLGGHSFEGEVCELCERDGSHAGPHGFFVEGEFQFLAEAEG
jgi:hypothetical protein